MGIKLLDKNVINQISAGEVIEKPASIVKELVENSIDAGATNITIEIKNGGIDYIGIIDNGCGIKAEEVTLAFTPHATSKLTKIDDLNTLCTMGFRGEALATISAVSKVTMVTKTQEQEVGLSVYLEGGEMISSNQTACVTGTKIDVTNIFYNTPARLKFLRKPKTEENDITNYVEKLILSHDTICFKYIVDGKIIYNTLSGSTFDNIYSIYGKEMASNMLEVKYELNGYGVKGYISKPEYSKANRSYQNLFVNGRFCNNPLISTAVSNAYENFTMKGKFPAYVLFLTLPQSEVDVNVHPNKLEVKFSNTQKIFRVFNDAVFMALSDFSHIRNLDNQEEDSLQTQIQTQDVNLQNLKSDEGVSYNDSKNMGNELDNYSNTFNSINKGTGTLDFRLTNSILTEVDLESSDTDSNNEPLQNAEAEKQTAPNESLKEQNSFKDILNFDYKLVGVAFNTYLILEFDNSLYLIDQHAAHERQKYDQIMSALDNNSLIVQDLMVPYIIKVSQNESNFLNDNLENLKSFGIDICEFGYNTYKISSVPMLLAEINLDVFFSELLENLNSLVKSPQQTIKSRFMQMACKSAIKGGDKLSDVEIQALLNKLKNETQVLLCPHGRPIVVEISQKQLEKWFKRIV